ncbi:MAG: hypothetical protein R3C03_00080 [Pirellulaceae bacterium]
MAGTTMNGCHAWDHRVAGRKYEEHGNGGYDLTQKYSQTHQAHLSQIRGREIFMMSSVDLASAAKFAAIIGVKHKLKSTYKMVTFTGC